MHISFQETSRVKPSSTTEITALLYKDNESNPGKRHVYTFPRNVPIWSSTYLTLQYPLLCFSGETGWSPGNYLDGRACKTLSTTGKPVENVFYSRQRLLIEHAYRLLSAVAQEFAVHQYARHDDLTLSYIQRELPNLRATSKNEIANNPSDRPLGTRLPATFHGSPVNS